MGFIVCKELKLGKNLIKLKRYFKEQFCNCVVPSGKQLRKDPTLNKADFIMLSFEVLDYIIQSRC